MGRKGRKKWVWKYVCYEKNTKDYVQYLFSSFVDHSFLEGETYNR